MQLAKAMDAGHISGVCSGKNGAIVSMLPFVHICDPPWLLPFIVSDTHNQARKQVMENGATEVVDYTQGDVVEHYTKQEVVVEKFDIVYDSASNSGGGEDYREKSLSLLKQDGSNHGRFFIQSIHSSLVVLTQNTTDLLKSAVFGNGSYCWPKMFVKLNFRSICGN